MAVAGGVAVLLTVVALSYSAALVRWLDSEPRHCAYSLYIKDFFALWRQVQRDKNHFKWFARSATVHAMDFAHREGLGQQILFDEVCAHFDREASDNDAESPFVFEGVRVITDMVITEEPRHGAVVVRGGDLNTDSCGGGLCVEEANLPLAQSERNGVPLILILDDKRGWGRGLTRLVCTR